MIIIYVIFTSIIAISIFFLNRSKISFAAKSPFSTDIKSQTHSGFAQNPKQENVLKINMHQPSQFNHNATGHGRIEGQTMNWLDMPWKVDMKPQIFIPETSTVKHTYERDDIETECCHNCGNHVRENDKFCIFCGSRLRH